MGPWTKEEDFKLLSWIKEYGPGKWTACSEFISGRSPKQCRERWSDTLNPEVKKGDWSPEEDFLIFKFYADFGSKWSLIAPKLPGRTANSVKNRFYSTLRRIKFEDKKQQSTMKDCLKNENSLSENDLVDSSASSHLNFTELLKYFPKALEEKTRIYLKFSEDRSFLNDESKSYLEKFGNQMTQKDNFFALNKLNLLQFEENLINFKEDFINFNKEKKLLKNKRNRKPNKKTKEIPSIFPNTLKSQIPLSEGNSSNFNFNINFEGENYNNILDIPYRNSDSFSLITIEEEEEENEKEKLQNSQFSQSFEEISLGKKLSENLFEIDQMQKKILNKEYFSKESVKETQEDFDLLDLCVKKRKLNFDNNENNFYNFTSCNNTPEKEKELEKEKEDNEPSENFEPFANLFEQLENLEGILLCTSSKLLELDREIIRNSQKDNMSLFNQPSLNNSIFDDYKEEKEEKFYNNSLIADEKENNFIKENEIEIKEKEEIFPKDLSLQEDFNNNNNYKLKENGSFFIKDDLDDNCFLDNSFEKRNYLFTGFNENFYFDCKERGKEFIGSLFEL